MTLMKFLEQYLSARSVSDDYAGTLRKRMAKISKFAGTGVLRKVLTEDVVNDFIKSLESEGLSPFTIRSYRGDVVSVWNGAADLDLVAYPILRRIRCIKRPQLVVECYTQSEAVALLAEAGKLKGAYPNGRGAYTNGVAKRDYWQATIRVAWDTGLRRGDVWKFRRSAIRPDNTVQVLQNKTRQIVVVKLHASTLKALEAIRRDQPCQWQLDRSFFGRHFKKIVVGSGVGRGTFKWLRRASGSYVDLQERGAGSKHLGHADPTMFDKHYDGKIGGYTLPMPPELGGHRPTLKPTVRQVLDDVDAYEFL